jgi:hypothetical protein
MNFTFETVNNESEFGSSALTLDLRNSTDIIRSISWDRRLTKQLDFMMNLHEVVYDALYKISSPDYFATNDTGDGFMCVFWDDMHAITCLSVAMVVKNFLDASLPMHNKSLKLNDNKKFDYNIAIHSGGSTINRITFKSENHITERDYMFGIVVNSVARLQAFGKYMKDCKLLVTGNYKRNYCKQVKTKEKKDLFNLNNAYPGKINLRDGKKGGHLIYALAPEFLNEFKKQLRI